MNQKPFDIAKTIWEHYSPPQAVSEAGKDKLAKDLASSLLRFFQVGESYYYLFNVSTAEFEYVSPSIEKVLGYRPEDATLAFLFNKVHPDDQKIFVNFENEVGHFLLGLPPEKIFKYKIRMDIRMQKSDGTYTRILYQVVAFEQHEDGRILRTLGSHADIGYLKMEGKPTLSFIGFDGEPSYIDVKVGRELIHIKNTISRREREVLTCIMNGMAAKVIAGHLYISLETVYRHRKNMLKRTGCQNSAELISKAIREGWI